jgi:phosphoribosylaminoimidazole-succinocarboxamide synthase
MCEQRILLETNLNLPLVARGKVRDIYDAGEALLFIATDRISAFDCILGSGIPSKGKVLTQISLFWFDFLKDVVPSHVITGDVNQFPPALSGFTESLTDRSMLVKRAEMVQVECVARGYLSGSGWKEYKTSGTVCGISLPPVFVKATAFPNLSLLQLPRPKPDMTRTFLLNTWPLRSGATLHTGSGISR